MRNFATFTLSPILLFTCASSVLAQNPHGFSDAQNLKQHYSVQSGFVGSVFGAVSTVSQLKAMRDDARTYVEGYILRHLRSDHYEFRDNTGSIDLEIDDKYWHGQVVTPKDKVRLLVEVDDDILHKEYEVKAPVVIIGTE